jgi:uncharacterized repeat protein (TIGR01451 family)
VAGGAERFVNTAETIASAPSQGLRVGIERPRKADRQVLARPVGVRLVRFVRLLRGGGAVRETATEAQDINDCASVSSATPDPNHANDESCDGVNIIAAADLSLEKLDSPDPLVAGTDITYTLNAHNAGPSTAKNVVIRDLLPNSVTVVSVSGGIGGVRVPGVPGDPAHPTLCSYATVAPLATKTMVIVVRVNAGDNRVITNKRRSRATCSIRTSRTTSRARRPRSGSQT